DFSAGFARIGIESLRALLAHEVLPLDTVRAADLPGPLHTLRDPILSYQAARAFFRGGVAVLPRFARPEEAAVGARNSLLRRYAQGADGRLSEDALEDAASECCRYNRINDCAAFFARWKHDHPDSARLPVALAGARRAVAEPELLSEANLASIARLFDAADDGRGAARPLARAEGITRRYRRYYHHAVPFDRSVLEAAWSACGVEGCEAERLAAEEVLGPLDGGPPAPRPPAAPRDRWR